MTVIDRILNWRPLLHLLFWTVSFYFIGSYFAVSTELSSIDFIYSCTFHICLIPLVYLNLSWLIPGFLQKGKYVWYLLLNLTNITLAFALHELVFEYALPVFLRDYYIVSFVDIFSLIQILILYLGFTSLLKFSKSWFQIQQLEKERIQLELEALRAQLNPHFLFNGLNSIYALALQRSDKTSAAVLKLSDLLRYSLYEINKESVPLDKEIENLGHYLALQKLRLKNDSIIHATFPEQTNGLKIAPMILLPLLENVFKHGDLNKEVKIEMKVKHSFSFLCENHVDVKDHPNEPTGSGIGLENIKRRLDLLYPGRYDLETNHSDLRYRVLLKIKL